MTNKIYIIICSFLLVSLTYSQPAAEISSSQQIIIVVTKSLETDQGTLIRFERNADSKWNSISDPIPVIIGKNGLAKSQGLVFLNEPDIKEKVEGDGKSPAGIFRLTKAFGFAPKETVGNLKIPYLQIEEGTECIDDYDSKYYNQIIKKNQAETKDWRSSEKMWKADPWYKLGVIIDVNKTVISTGKGSCLFLHNWDGPNDSTSGCTAMTPEVMKEIILWLDIEKEPILVQLTTELYDKYRDYWGLPNLN